jgi:SAM-dependent methyltransferase
MVSRLRVEGDMSAVLPGRAADYLDTAVHDPEHLALLGERRVLLQVLRDQAGLPTTAAREGYFDDRHLEYWLSGYRDATRALAAAGLPKARSGARLLDFGGASGRIVRHLRYLCAGAELYLCAINPSHVQLTRTLLGAAVHAFHNRGDPSLPFPDHYLDGVLAFSVFTHIDADDTAWLLELQRILKPGGTLYLTVHDDATWRNLPTNFLKSTLGQHEFRMYYDTHQELRGKVASLYSDASDYNCNVFVSSEYIRRFWAPLFETCEIRSGAHDPQAGVAFTTRMR